jgi:hypothetical protein
MTAPRAWLLTSPPAWLVGWLILAAVIAAIAAIAVTHHTY